MKYCISASCNSETRRKADQIVISSIQDIYKNLNDTEHKFHFLMSSINQKDIMALLELKSKYPNFNFNVRISCKDKESLEHLKKHNIPFSFKEFVTNWDMLDYFINIGVDNLTIAEELGFSIKKVSKLVHAANIELHVIPNVAQSSIKETPAFRKFFIRPEDVDTYEPYVDVFDLYGSSTMQEVAYDVYTDKLWFGNLNEIIGLDDIIIDNRSILSTFAEMRLNCDKQCFKGSKCRLCDIYKDLSITLSDRHIIVGKP